MDVEQKMKLLHSLAKCDREYRQLEKEFAVLEQEASKILMELTDEQQDVVWKFFFMSDELDRLLLKIACGFIQFDKN